MYQHNTIPRRVFISLLLIGLGHRAQSQILEGDPVDAKTGEHLRADGTVPPRSSELSTPNVALLPTAELWHMIERCSGGALIALKPAKFERGFFCGEVLLSDSEFKSTKKSLFTRFDSMKAPPPDAENKVDNERPVLSNGTELAAFVAKSNDRSTLEQLRALPVVDFIEHACIQFFDVSACGADN